MCQYHFRFNKQYEDKIFEEYCTGQYSGSAGLKEKVKQAVLLIKSKTNVNNPSVDTKTTTIDYGPNNKKFKVTVAEF
jgi:hypothetical protein